VDKLLAKWPRWPATRKAWLSLVTRLFPILPPRWPDGRVPSDAEVVNLNRVDLGRRVEELAGKLRPGARLALRLTGSGPCPTRPIKVKGIHLGLYFEAPGKGPDGKGRQPLTLVPRGATGAKEEALIDLRGGSLEIVGGRIRFEGRSLPHFMVRVRRGDLRLFRCRLEAPLIGLPEGYRGLVRFEGVAKPRVEDTPICAIKECILRSGGLGVQVVGSGARLYMKGSVVLVAGDALDFDPDESPPAVLNVTVSLETNTLAVSGAVLHLADARKPAGLTEPMIVRADNNLFLDPFHTQTGHASGMVRFDKAGLARGLLLWQGQDNGFDVKRLHNYAVAAGDNPPGQSFEAWPLLWGPLGEREPRLLDLRDLPTEFRPRLEQLRLPPRLRPRSDAPPLGADLDALGVGK
jgi:hypothetical protein